MMIDECYPQTVRPDEIAAYKRDKEARLIKYLNLDFTGDSGTVATCLICKRSMTIASSDNFTPYKIWAGKSERGNLRQKMLKTNKEALQHFQDTHWNSCIGHFGVNGK